MNESFPRHESTDSPQEYPSDIVLNVFDGLSSDDKAYLSLMYSDSDLLGWREENQSGSFPSEWVSPEERERLASIGRKARSKYIKEFDQDKARHIKESFFSACKEKGVSEDKVNEILTAEFRFKHDDPVVLGQ